MNKQIVTVQLRLDESSLYFRDLGEMLSRHVSELCSKGNFGHDFAAGIYRTLAKQLENAEFDVASSENLESLARKGFDEAMYGADEPQVSLNIQTDSLFDDDDDRTFLIGLIYHKSKEAKKLHAILEKYVSISSDINDNPIRILTDEITPRVEDFRKAQSSFLKLAKSKGLRIEKSASNWKRSATIDEILKEEGKIVFYKDALTQHSWRSFITRCIRHAAAEATEEDISSFVGAYSQLPDGFQTADSKIDETFMEWIRRVRCALDQRLSVGMFNDDIKAFSQEFDLPPESVT